MTPTKFSGYKMIVCAIFICAGGIGFTYYTLSLFLPSWIETFGCTLGEGSIAFSIIGLTTMLASFATSGVVGKVGLKRLFALGVACMVIGYALFFVAPNLAVLYVGGGFIGVGVSWSGMIPLGTIAPNWFVEKQGLMTGLVAASTGVDGVVSNLLYSQMITSMGWRMSALITVGIVLACCVPALIVLKPTPQEVGQQPLGYVADAESDKVAVDSSAEYKAARKTPSFWLLCVLVFCISSLITGLNPHVASIVTSHGYDLIFAGTVSSILQVANVVGSFVMGIVSDKWRVTGALAYSLFIGVVSMAAIFFTGSQAGCITFGIAFGMAQAMVTTLYPLLVAPAFGTAAFGQIVGFFNGVNGMGEAIMPSVAGFIVTFAGTYNAVAAMMIAIITFGVFCGFVALRKAPRVEASKANS